ncbi:MAG: serine/threonine-protein kinase [Gaiellaceae bacterium]
MSSLAGSELAPGTIVAGFQVEALIGRGGMGAVYRAAEEGLGRNVALKVIAPALAQDERFRERFLRESRIAASFDHPHVVPIYQAGEEGGLLYLAMRYVEGTDLAKLIAEEGTLEPRRALELLAQVAEALDAAHEHGLVHRDVKPSNVLIAESAGSEHCYLGDFGLTKRTGSLSGISVAGEIVGTLEYVAPEQITGNLLDERSDVYSLGCVLYECLTGQAPFPRATDVALLWAHVHEEPPPPSEARPELSRELDTVLARALAKEPGRRYRSAGELVEATRSALSLAPSETAGRRSRLASGVVRARSARGLVQRAHAHQRPGRTILAGFAALLALVLAAALAAFLLARDSGGLAPVSPNSVGVIDPASNELVAEIPVGVNPEGIALDRDSAWVANSSDGTVMQIDRRVRQVSETVSIGRYPTDVRSANAVLWVALAEYRAGRSKSRSPAPVGSASSTIGSSHFVAGLDWFTFGIRSLQGRTRIEGRACVRRNAFLAVDEVALGKANPVWLGCDSFLSRAVTGTKAASFARVDVSAVSPWFSDVALGLGSIWLTDRAADTMAEIDPVTRREVRLVDVGDDPSAIAVGLGSVWVANFESDTVTRIEPSGPRLPVRVETISVGDGPADVAVGGNAVWVVNGLDGTVSRIDAETKRVVATITIGNEPRRVAASATDVWVTVRGAVSPGPEGSGG